MWWHGGHYSNNLPLGYFSITGHLASFCWGCLTNRVTLLDRIQDNLVMRFHQVNFMCSVGKIRGLLWQPLEVLANLSEISGFNIKQGIGYFLALWNPRQGSVLRMNVGINFLRHDLGTGLPSLSELKEKLSQGTLEVSSPGWGFTAWLSLPLKKLFTLHTEASSSLAAFYSSGPAEESRRSAAGFRFSVEGYVP